MANPMVSRSAPAASTPARRSSAAIPTEAPDRHALDAQTCDRAVLAEDRCHVRYGPDRCQCGQLRAESVVGATTIAEQQRRETERQAGPGQAPVRVGRVGSVGIHERHRRRRRLGHAVMVGDDDIDPARHRLGYLVALDDPQSIVTMRVAPAAAAASMPRTDRP